MNEIYDSVIIEDSSDIIDGLVSELASICSAKVVDNFVDGLSYIAENNIKILFCLSRYSISFEERVISFVDKVNEINPFIVKIIFDCPSDWIKNRTDLINKYNLIVFPSGCDNSEICESIKNNVYTDDNKIKRRFSRVDWPLNVQISFDDSAKETITRNVLSISGNGAYISSENFMPRKNDRLTLTISFKDFKLFTDSEVVWLNGSKQKPNLPEGFAVTFIDIGFASQKVIDSIIKDKIIKRVLFDFKTGT